MKRTYTRHKTLLAVATRALIAYCVVLTLLNVTTDFDPARVLERFSKALPDGRSPSI